MGGGREGGAAGSGRKILHFSSNALSPNYISEILGICVGIMLTTYENIKNIKSLNYVENI